MTLNQLKNQVMTRATQAALWTLKRYDYYINKSITSIGNPAHYQNPYRAYNTLRARNPVLRSASNRGWIVTGFEDVATLLQHKDISNDIRSNQFFVRLLTFAVGDREVPLIDNPTMLNQDAPDHTRLRRLVLTGFTHKYIQSLAPMIERVVDELLDQIKPDTTEFDLIDRLARPLPAIVIAEMLGVPKQDRHQFERWSEALLGLSEISKPHLIQAAAEANQEMRAYIAIVTEQKRQNPGDDLISKLIEAESDGDSLSLDELYSTCVLILTAGHETTARLIGNCLFHLLQDPTILASVRQDETLLMKALEETLRFEPPVQNTLRFVKKPMLYKGHQFKQGQLLLLSIAGANRDPLINPDPNRFDIFRQDAQYLSFGHGIHLCIGISLARLEARIALTKLLNRYPQLSHVDSKPNWGTNDFFRGLTSFRLSTQSSRSGLGKHGPGAKPEDRDQHDQPRQAQE